MLCSRGVLKLQLYSFGLWNVNFIGREATSKYYGLLNLYLRVCKNLGLTSCAKSLTSSIAVTKLSNFIPVIFSISLFQIILLFFVTPAAKIRALAAISEGLYLSK